MSKSGREVILTGFTPSSKCLHFGNYVGAIKPLVELQNKNADKDFFLFVSDLHALTNPSVNLKEIDKKVFICTFLAGGVDLKKVILFYQSDVPAHAELGWVLTCHTTFGELSRMTQFKDKSVRLNQGNGTESIPTGLLVYPPLMAADILLYDSNLIPVGKDQKQHVELTRNIAERFNKKYGETFVLPEPYITENNPEIMDLQDPSKKMSKSAASKNGVIFLTDTTADVQNKIKVALTDSLNKVKYDKVNQPAVSNLIMIYSALTGLNIKQIEEKFANIKNYGEFKKEISEEMVKWLSHFQSEYAKAEANFASTEKIIKENAVHCSKIADAKVDEVYKKIGLR